MASRAYLDWNASAPLRPAARAAMLDALDLVGNPSSVHAEGRRLRRLVDEARNSIARLVGGDAANIVFTSGATEAALMLLTPHWRMGRAPLSMGRLYVTASDHPCVLSGGRFPADRVTVLPVLRSGLLDLPALEASLSAHPAAEGPALVATHAASNETGVIQPVDEIAAIVRGARGVLVVDAVQAAGRLPIDMAAGYADHLILSAHKIGGPKGAGAIVSAGQALMPAPLLTGGGQERGLRAGTENVAAIAGFGVAAAEALAEVPRFAALAAKRDAVEAKLGAAFAEVTVFGHEAPRLANTSFFSLEGLSPETAQIAFDLEGVALSSGSACSSGRVGPSHVLKAMGYGDMAGGLRVSFGLATEPEEFARFEAAARIIAGRLAKARAA